MSRLPFVDWVRGLAVVAMVVWHTVDAWLEVPLRAGEGWAFLRFFGGLAAPSFLFLAGVSAALSARPRPPGEEATRAFLGSLGRGLEVVLFGYLLRYQTWLIDAAEIKKLSHAHVWLTMGVGYGLLVWSTHLLASRPRRALWVVLGGLSLLVVSFVQVEGVAPGRTLRLLQVDVLQAIGMSLVLLALLERSVGLLQKPAWAALLGLGVALLTVPLADRLPGPLPQPVAGYLGTWPTPKGGVLASRFPLFPWFAYACVGAAMGTLLRKHRAEPGTVLLVLGTLGGALALGTSESLAAIANAHAKLPWLVAVTRVAYRVGLVLVLLLVGYAWTGFVKSRVLVPLGNASLRVYWVHMMFAYGILGKPLQRTSSYAEWALWVIPLLIAMWGLAQIGRKNHPKPGSPVAGAPAEAR